MHVDGACQRRNYVLVKELFLKHMATLAMCSKNYTATSV